MAGTSRSTPVGGGSGGARSIRVAVRFVGQLAASGGGTGVSLDLPSGATLDDARREIEARYPKLASAGEIVMFVNGRNAEHDGGGARSLQDGDRIVWTGPLGGG